MVVGIDFDTHNIYLCVFPLVKDQWHPPQPEIVVAPIRNGSGTIQQAISSVPSALAFAIQRGNIISHTPAWVERGTGMSRKGDWVLGAVAGAIIATWPRLTSGASCRLVTTSDWKKHLGAPGNSNKATANTYAKLHWQAHFTSQPPTDHNHLDAYGIAVYAAHH